MKDSFNSRHRCSFKKAIATRPSGQRWIPAPALSQRANSKDAPRTSFPLCLVCDEWARGERGRADNAEELARQFEANSALLKELDDTARLSGDRQRLRVMRRLWEMDGGTSGQKLQKWHDILKAEATFVHSPVVKDKSPDDADGKSRRKHEKRERSSRRRKRGAQAEQSQQRPARRIEDSKGETNKKAEIDQKNLTESIGAKMVEKDGIGDKINREELLECLELIERSMASSINDEAPAPIATRKEAARKKEKSGKRVTAAAADENDSTDVSQSLRDEAADNGDEGRKTESDFFIEVIIDELKKENRDLKFDLMAREKQLEKAAEKVKEVLDENAKLAKKLDKAVARVQDQAEAFTVEVRAKDEEHESTVGALEERIKRLEHLALAGPGDVDRRKVEGMEEGMAVAEELRLRLAESERKNSNLEKYVDEMKKSYEAVFGNANSAQRNGPEE